MYSRLPDHSELVFENVSSFRSDEAMLTVGSVVIGLS
jgi:hypothetical protein